MYDIRCVEVCAHIFFLLFQLGTLDHLTTKVADVGVSTLNKIFVKHLDNVTVKNDVLKLTDEIRNKSQYVKSDIDNIKTSVSKISLEQLLSTTQDAEFYRYVLLNKFLMNFPFLYFSKLSYS